MTGEPDCLSSIYDAAIDPSRWGEALDAITEEVAATSAVLLTVDRDEHTPLTVRAKAGGLKKLDPAVIDEYISTYWPLESQRWQALRLLPEHQIQIDSSVFPDLAGLRGRADYRYLHDRMGIFRRMAARLNDNQSCYDAIGFHFASDRHDIPDYSLLRARQILPHLARALQMNQRYTALQSRHQAALGALNFLPFGVCVVLADMTVIECNHEARRIIDGNDGLGVDRHARLIGTGTDELKRSVQQICLATTGKAGPSRQSLLLERTRRDHPLVVEMLPLRNADHEPGHPVSGVIITMTELDRTPGFSVNRLSRLYKLSDAESAVCQHLLNGWSNRRIALAREVAVDTVKTQIRSVLFKTGTSRRIDLIRLAAQISPALTSTDPP